MTVFKGYLLMAQKNFVIVALYITVFAVITISVNSSSDTEPLNIFSADKLDLHLIDQDNSELSKLVIKFLEDNHNITFVEDNLEAIQENLYYEKIDAALRIKNGFQANCMQDLSSIELVACAENYNSFYLEQQLNDFIGNLLHYENLGYTLEESYEMIENLPEAKMNLIDLNGNGGKIPEYAGFFKYLPYLFIGALGTVIGMILVTFRTKEIKKRMMASKLPLLQQNAEGILAFLIIGTLLYSAVCMFAIIYYGKAFTQCNNFYFYLLNGFIDMLTALSISYIVGLILTDPKHINMIITPLSLGLSFIGGVFVPLDMLSSTLKQFAKFIPIYWYENVNNLLSSYSNPAQEIRNQIWQGMGIQALFVAVFIGLAIVIAKYKQQEH